MFGGGELGLAKKYSANGIFLIFLPTKLHIFTLFTGISLAALSSEPVRDHLRQQTEF